MPDIRIKVVVKRVGEEPVVLDIPNTLAEFQGIVEGYIEDVSLHAIGGRFVTLANEEGIRLGLRPNVFGLLGNLVVTKASASGDFVSLTVSEQAEVIRQLRTPSL